jgi:TatA/E family protein of Tat protein translocase
MAPGDRRESEAGMFGSFGAPEIAIIAVVVVLLFGIGKISGLGRELGSSIKEFRRAVKDGDEEEQAKENAQLQAPPQQYNQQQPPVQQYAPPPPQQYAPPQQPQYAPPPPQPPAQQQNQGDSKNIF